MLSFIEWITFNNNKSPIKARFKCDCWNECIKYYTNFYSWISKDCWCVYKNKKNNILEKYWKLKVIKSYFLWDRFFADCLCDCWIYKNKIYVPSLRSNSITSCWCIRLLGSKPVHGHTVDGKKTRIYKIWTWIQWRCVNKKSKAYPRYWWVGILCDRSKFIDFYNDMWKDYEDHIKKYWEKDTTIDRIDNTKWYNKKNCRRATPKEQWSNKNNNIIKWMSLLELCKKNWKNYTTILNNIHVRSQNKERNKELYIKNLFNI